MTMALDIEDRQQLLAYLSSTGRIREGEVVDIQTLSGGVSCRTVRVGGPHRDPWVLKQALGRLRVASEWRSEPRRVLIEAQALATLPSLISGDMTPRLVFVDRDAMVLAMEAVAEPHDTWKTLLLRGDVDFDIVHQVASLLAALHRNSNGRPDIQEQFSDRSFFETLRLQPYYATTGSRLPQARRFLDELSDATLRRRVALTHGDFSPKNILISRGRPVLLDHEVIHFGDPSFDLGFSMTHLLSKAHHVTQRRGALHQAARLYWDTYAAATLDTLGDPGFEPMAVKHTIGCLLARVEGRSPLEYLTPSERARQVQVSLLLAQDIPASMPALIDAFVDGIAHA